jgi:Domain of unknown function (DUF5666)
MKKMNLIGSIAIASLVFVGCSGSNSSASSTSANVDGTVSSATGALKVSVPGSNQSATTDAKGNFALIGVPSGATALRFSGSGVDATLSIVALMAGEDRHVAVSVAGGKLDDHPEQDGSRFNGTVTSITSPALTVSGHTVTTTSATSFLDDSGNATTLDAITIGSFVEVEGAPQADGSVIARTIKLEDNLAADGGEAGDDNGNKDGGEPGDDNGAGGHGGNDGTPGNGALAQFDGAVTAATATSLTVNGVTVTVSATTEIEGSNETQIAFSAITVGEFVEVKGVAQTDGSILASKIEVQAAGEVEDAHISGAVTAVDAVGGSVTVGTTTVLVVATTRFEGITSLADVKVGDMLNIEATAAADGTLTATEIKAASALPPPLITEIRGAITALTATTIAAQGQTFTVNASTRMDDNGNTFTLSSLTVGQIVDVRGTLQADGTLLASRIQLRNN